MTCCTITWSCESRASPIFDSATASFCSTSPSFVSVDEVLGCASFGTTAAVAPRSIAADAALREMAWFSVRGTVGGADVGCTGGRLVFFVAEDAQFDSVWLSDCDACVTDSCSWFCRSASKPRPATHRVVVRLVLVGAHSAASSALPPPRTYRITAACACFSASTRCSSCLYSSGSSVISLAPPKRSRACWFCV